MRTKPGKRQSLLTRVRLRVFHSPVIFLSETERFVPGHTRVFVLFPVVSGRFPFSTVSHTEIRHSIFALVDLCCTCIPLSRPGDIFLLFFYYSILSLLLSLSRSQFPLLFSPSSLQWVVKKIARLWLVDRRLLYRSSFYLIAVY